jgi:hypothetical protein
MTERKMVRQRERWWGDFDRPAVDVRKEIQGLIDQYGESVSFEKEREYDYGCCSDGYDVFYIVYEREETDAEMAKRLKAAEKAKASREAAKVKNAAKKAAAMAAKEENERAELARLLKKYGEG